jgi:hypothetical protein
MATTDNLQVLASPNREFGLQVLRHMRTDGIPVYTIGIWEEGVLRCICHAHPIATALVALSREFEHSAHDKANAPEYRLWSEIAELASRLMPTGAARSHPLPSRATNYAAITAPMISADPAQASDTPSCLHCGSLTQRNGACHICANCGSTTGCS